MSDPRAQIIAIWLAGLTAPPSVGRCLPRARQIISALSTAGFIIVPRFPTEAMIEAGDDIFPIARGTETHRLAGGKVPEDYWAVMADAALAELNGEAP